MGTKTHFEKEAKGNLNMALTHNVCACLKLFYENYQRLQPLPKAKNSLAECLSPPTPPPKNVHSKHPQIKTK